MKPIRLPAVKMPPVMQCCGNQKAHDFVFQNNVGDCCGDMGGDFLTFLGIQSTDLSTLTEGGYIYNGTCPATLRFTAHYSNYINDPDATMMLVVTGVGSQQLGWLEQGPYTEVVIQPGWELAITVTTNLSGGDPVTNGLVTLDVVNVTCGTNLGEILNWTMDAVPCCAEQTPAPWFAPLTDPGDFADTSGAPYEFVGSCEISGRIKFTFDNIANDPFVFADLTHNGTPEGLVHDTWLTQPYTAGDIISLSAGLGITGLGPGTFTFWFENLTCGTPPEVIWTVTLGS